MSEEVRLTDSLANERTFLAYARTALAFVGLGFVIARFALFTREVAAVVHLRETSNMSSTFFGAAMALAGVLCAAYGAYRYVTTARALRAGANLPMHDRGAITISTIIGVIGFAVMWTIFAVR
jgi:putative membrane protein